MIGWISLHRSLLDHKIWLMDKFTYGQAWIDLLLLANSKPNTVRIRGIIINIKIGQLFWSIDKLSKRWKWNFRTTKRFLRFLVDEKMIILKIENNLTLITICNYEYFQNNKKVQYKFKQTGIDKIEVFDDVMQNKVQYKVQNKVQYKIQDKVQSNNNELIINNNIYNNHEDFFSLSELLFEKISKHRKIEKPNLSTWSKELYMIHKKLDKSYDNIKKAIEFSQNPDYLNDKYFPVVLCARSLREKYQKLIDYRRRLESKNIEKKPFTSSTYKTYYYYDKQKEAFMSWSTLHGPCPYKCLIDSDYYTLTFDERMKYLT